MTGPSTHSPSSSPRPWLLSTLTAIVFAFAAAGFMIPAHAEEGYKVSQKSGKFEDVIEDLQDAILKRGFVIDYTGELNAMLERTAKDTGAVKASGKLTPFKNAKFLQFCPAKLTHEAVAMNPMGIANCPVAIFVFELDHDQGVIKVGYRLPVTTPSRKAREVNDRLEATLAEIVAETVK